MNRLKNHFKRFNIILLVITIFTSSFCLTGCFDKNEIEKLGFVVALGIDLDNHNKIIVSLQILESSDKSQTEKDTKAGKSKVYICTGNTIYDALYNLSKGLSIPIKFSNEKCIIIGKKFAEAGIKPIIDFSLRFNDMRPTTPVLVTNGDAVDILQMQAPENPISAFVIHDLIKRQKYLCLASTTTNLDFANNMKSESSISTCGIINIDKENKKNLNNSLILSGSAVFRKDKLIGYMNAEETRGMQWIKGKVKLGSLVIKTRDENKISLHIIKSNSSLKPSIIDKKVDIRVNIKAQSNIQEISEHISEDMNFNTNPDIIDRLSKEQDKAIYNEANLAINAAQDRLSADIFDFGNLLYRECPHEWNSIKGDWNKLFPYVNIEIGVSSEIKQTGILSKPITNEEGN
jgi:germination protein, Ger(x)C family